MVNLTYRYISDFDDEDYEVEIWSAWGGSRYRFEYDRSEDILKYEKCKVVSTTQTETINKELVSENLLGNNLVVKCPNCDHVFGE